MPIKLNKLTPNIMVEDVNRALQFYRETLGFEIVATVPDEGQFDWAMLKRDGVEIMFQSRASLGGEIPVLQQREIGGALTFYMNIEGIKELYADLKGKVSIVQEMHTTFYGAQEFALQDSDGYILSFAETVS